MVRGSRLSAAVSKGDLVWVFSGNQHEETGIVLDTGCKWTPAETLISEDEESKKKLLKANRFDGVLVRFDVSNLKQVFPPDKVRPMEGQPLNGGLRRSRRIAAAPEILSSASETVETTDAEGEQTTRFTSPCTTESNNEKIRDDTTTRRSIVTPSPMIVGKKRDPVKEERKIKKSAKEQNMHLKRQPKHSETHDNPEEATRKKQRKEPTSIEAGTTVSKKSDAEKPPTSSPFFEKTVSRLRKAPIPKVSKSSRGKKGTPEDEDRPDEKEEPDNQPSSNFMKNCVQTKKEDTLICVPIQDNSEAECESGEVAAAFGVNDDNYEDFSEDRPYTVSYASTGRSTCRSCDDLIGKGALRIAHKPLFRGKPGFTFYRHLKCAGFEGTVHRAQDVCGWSLLKKKDLEALEQRVEESKEELEEERKEMQPDELVQTTFTGEIRPSPPPGVVGNLLPFQVEGFSWMRHQEVNDEAVAEGACRGGILADEMGMGKTLQTIATMCDNRPLLQHCRPGMKHAPNAPDLEARLREESLWEKASGDWNNELKMNEISERMRPKRDLAGSRAGTLVICPVIALLQWKSEIEKFTEDGFLSVGIYHGGGRNSEMPPDMLRKYDVVLTTYQCLEQDFRKMMSPNKVSCPNCGAKFKMDKLRVHLKYFCGEGAERTEAQSRQRRSSNHRGGPAYAGVRSGRGKGKSPGKKSGVGLKTKTSTPVRKIATKRLQSTPEDDYDSESDLSVLENITETTSRPRRSAAKKALTKLAKEDDSVSPSESSYESESSCESEDDIPVATLARKRRAAEITPSSDEEDEDPIARIKEKQRKALAIAKMGKGSKKGPMQTSAGKKGEKEKMEKGPKKGPMQTSAGKKGKKVKQGAKAKSKGKSKKSEDDPLADIDMQELAGEAMAGAKFSVLHSFCWWRIVLDEAHYIKSRSSQTAAAAFSLTGIHRWCCSGTPLQNRVGELYSLIRFLQLDPMGHYFCRINGCGCKNAHYRMKDGICKDCGHRAFSHYSHFNRHILNVIQRDGYVGDGRRAMFKLKKEVLDKCLLRRTKETRAEDMNLPPRIVNIKTLRLHPIEEDFYNALYTQTRSSFNDYVTEGTLLNNYAHIFDLLTKMRQAVDHPYLLVYSKNAKIKGLAPACAAPVANGSVDCELCHEPPTDRILSSCCGSGFCRSCVEEYIDTAVGGGDGTRCPCCEAPFSINLNQKSVATDTSMDDGNLEVTPIIDSSTVPTLKNLSHVQTGSILRRINLAEFATSTKIETLVQDLIEMRQERPGSKALVFSQFVNMLDLIRWRLHSDPFLAHMGLGVRILHGAMNVKSRDQAIREFREDPTVRVLLMSLKAGGVALNLTVASEVFLVDNWWNPAAEMQAIDRTHRLGQHRVIRATRYVCQGTVEERVLQLQEKKRLVFDGTVGGDAGSLKALSEDDMKALFT